MCASQSLRKVRRMDGWLNKAAADGDRGTRWYEGVDKDRGDVGRKEGMDLKEREGVMFEEGVKDTLRRVRRE